MDRARLARHALTMPPGATRGDDALRVPGVFQHVGDAVERRRLRDPEIALRLVEDAKERADLPVVRVDRAAAVFQAVLGELH